MPGCEGTQAGRERMDRAGHVPVHARQAPVRRFPEPERRFLLAQPRIGDRMVARMEMAGFHSLAALRNAGAANLATAVCGAADSVRWANRLRALSNALSGPRPDQPCADRACT